MSYCARSSPATPGDLEKLSSAIRQGQFYMSLDILGNPKGFIALVRGKEGQIFPMGSELKFEEGLTLEVTLPQKPKVPFDTVIYRNGESMMTSNSQVTQYFINSPGVYRVLVRVIPTMPLPDGKKWIPWIYTNMFHIQSKSVGTRTTKPGVLAATDNKAFRCRQNHGYRPFPVPARRAGARAQVSVRRSPDKWCNCPFRHRNVQYLCHF